MSKLKTETQNSKIELNAFLHTELEPIVPSPLDSQALAQGDGELKGLKIAIKDNILVKDWPATAGSKILEGFIAPYDATVIRRLKESGATLVGKTNLDEFAMGSSTENSAFGPTKNPWDIKRVPGGSSGGSAAAVAADLCAGALGSDTGGSIRYPAGFCGVVGLKTSYGRVSRSGLLSMTSSTDVIGPLAKTVSDAAILLGAIAGPDPHDMTCSPQPINENDYLEALHEQIDLSGVTLGVVKEWMEHDGLTPGVRKVVERSIEA